jgi:hypothetical protein
MTAGITNDERGTQRGDATRADRGIENRSVPGRRSGSDLRVFRFARPDGSTYEISFGDQFAGSTAETWAHYFRHKLISEVEAPSRAAPAPRPPEPAELQLSPPPLVEAEEPKPKPKPKP